MLERRAKIDCENATVGKNGLKILSCFDFMWYDVVVARFSTLYILYQSDAPENYFELRKHMVKYTDNRDVDIDQLLKWNIFTVINSAIPIHVHIHTIYIYYRNCYDMNDCKFCSKSLSP